MSRAIKSTFAVLILVLLSGKMGYCQTVNTWFVGTWSVDPYNSLMMTVKVSVYADNSSGQQTDNPVTAGSVYVTYTYNNQNGYYTEACSNGLDAYGRMQCNWYPDDGPGQYWMMIYYLGAPGYAPSQTSYPIQVISNY